MTDTASRLLARRRLWLGISNVGIWVLGAATGLYWLTTRAPQGSSLSALIFAMACVLAVQSIGDAIGGWRLMPVPRPSFARFLWRWVRGVLVYTLVLAMVAGVSLLSLQLTGGFVAGVCVSMITLALARPLMLRLVSGAATRVAIFDGEAIHLADVDDPAFTGSILGVGGQASIVLPMRWPNMLPPEELRAEIARRRWQRAAGLPQRTLLLLIGWNSLGAYTGTQLFDLAQRDPAIALLGHGCWMTLWAFLGLLVLPVLSRRAVVAADQAAAAAGQDPRDWIARFPTLVGEDGSSRNAVQTIFYPIPSAARRLHLLRHPVTGVVPGDLARSNLYYSWATFSLLGRAVHCNVGRPALWVVPPSA